MSICLIKTRNLKMVLVSLCVSLYTHTSVLHFVILKTVDSYEHWRPRLAKYRKA
jgi:hypothetical protein